MPLFPLPEKSFAVEPSNFQSPRTFEPGPNPAVKLLAVSTPGDAATVPPLDSVTFGSDAIAENGALPVIVNVNVPAQLTRLLALPPLWPGDPR